MEAYRSAPRLDTPTWQSKQHEISARLHARIIAGGYSAAETDIAALVGGTDCRLFDAVLVEDFTTPIPVFAARLHGWIADAHRAGATALSVDLGRGLGDPKLWSCDVCGLSDRVYPFSTSSREELLTAPEPGPWRGHGGWRPPDGIRIDGFENYIAAGMAHSPADTADAAVAENLPVMVGLKYLRFVDAAVRASASTIPMWIIAQDHDSYWIPRGISRTHG
jgi:hypothetical protein